MRTGRVGLGGEVADLFGRQPGYLRLLAVRVASQFGDGAFNVGLAGLFFFSPHRATTPETVAWALTAGLLPYTLVSPLAGVLLDRWHRRQVLVVANTLRVCLVVSAAGLVVVGAPTPLLVVVALTCLGVDRFVLTGVQAALPHVVERRLLVLANSVTPTLGTVSMLTGAGAAIVAVRALGAGDRAGWVALLVGSLAYLTATVLTATVRPRAWGPDVLPRTLPLVDSAGQILRGIGQGASHILGREPGRWAFSLILTTRVGFGVFTIITILLSRNTFTDSADDGLALVGLVVAAAGVGTASASVLTPVGIRLLGQRTWVLTCLGCAGGVLLVWAGAMNRWTFLGLAVLLGLALQGVKIVIDTTLQVTADEPYLGRVFSLADVAFNTSLILAGLLAAAGLIPVSGHPPGLLLGLAVLHVAMAGWTLVRRSAPHTTLRR